MKGMRALAAAAALLAATGAQAQASRGAESAFCRDLERLLDRAPDFDALYNARPDPPWLGFRPGACRAYGRAYMCHQSLAPDSLTLAGLAAATAACLPHASRRDDPAGRETVFALPVARILIRESGGPRAHVGRIVTFRVEADPPPARR